MAGLFYFIFISLFITSFELFSSENKPSELNFKVYYQQENSTSPEVAIMYAHGFGATQWQGKRLFAKCYGINGNNEPLTNTCWLYDHPMVFFNFPDAKNDKLGCHREFVNLAGSLDMEYMTQAHNKARYVLPETKFIGAGVSRGASSWLVFMSKQPTPDNIVALILEAGFDNIDSIITTLLQHCYASWLPYGKNLGRYVMNLLFPSLDFTTPSPLDVITTIPQDLPILLIHSRPDKIVPVKCGRALYSKLRITNHRNVHYLELEHGKHGKIIWGNDQETYQNTVHAFLKEYNLPHCSEFAAKGQESFATTQPTIKDLLKL